MKRLSFFLLISTLVLASCTEVVVSSAATGEPPVTSTRTSIAKPRLVFQSSFDIPEWTQGGGRDPEPSNDAIKHYGDWTTGGKGDQIIAAANRPGSPGNGFRHYRGVGKNSNGGGLKITLPQPVKRFWIRYYMRYSPGFAFMGGAPAYTKELYFNPGGRFLIFGYQGGAWGAHYYGRLNIPSIARWSETPPGSWNLFEYHVDQSEGLVELWLNGTLVLSRGGLDLGNVPWAYFSLGSNQYDVANGGYTDYDDIAVSTDGRIGPFKR